ncbi:MAG: alanine racemase [Burkholderiaceae bacterium]|jgi:alanine racemase|nr:alanine racemase [Burkholderiales bacterium]MCZ8340057.1 alanine racemase [Burkholderiaceae bacterium]
MPRPVSASVSVSALAHNLFVVRRRAAGTRVWAVVKAHAYGHGLPAAIRGFAAADGMALVEFDNARRLRALGWRGPILMLEGAFGPADVATAAELGLSLVVHDAGQVAWLRAHEGRSIDVWLKLNTGMNRLGVAPDEASALQQALAALPCVGKVSLMTHFADADRPGGAQAAIERFDRATGELSGSRSMANSAAIFDVPEAHRDWVRPGIVLYGASPFADRGASALGLRAAMTLRSELIAVQSLKAGDAVGYGSTFVADAPMRVGIVACGYADGYPRHAPTGTPIDVGGTRTRTVGRVSMDMLAVDLGPVSEAGVGTPVELWGERVPVDEVAASAGTVGYELLCAVAPRVPMYLVD